MVKSGIYKITNTDNGKIYIGSACDIEKRQKSHLSSLKRNDHHNRYLQRSWNKYGEEVFVFEVIEFIQELETLLEREQYWLDETKCYDGDVGYNISKHADAPMRGRVLSKEHKNKLSVSMRGMKHSEEAKRKIGKASTGSKNPNAQRVVRIHPQTGEEEEYECMKDAEKDGFTVSNISHVCRGKRKMHGGFIVAILQA